MESKKLCACVEGETAGRKLRRTRVTIAEAEGCNEGMLQRTSTESRLHSCLFVF